jgi:hypothetical protein
MARRVSFQMEMKVTDEGSLSVVAVGREPESGPVPDQLRVLELGPNCCQPDRSERLPKTTQDRTAIRC